MEQRSFEAYYFVWWTHDARETYSSCLGDLGRQKHCPNHPVYGYPQGSQVFRSAFREWAKHQGGYFLSERKGRHNLRNFWRTYGWGLYQKIRSSKQRDMGFMATRLTLLLSAYQFYRKTSKGWQHSCWSAFKYNVRVSEPRCPTD